MTKRRCRYCGTRMRRRGWRCRYCRRSAVSWLHCGFVAAFALIAAALYVMKTL